MILMNLSDLLDCSKGHSHKGGAGRAVVLQGGNMYGDRFHCPH